MHYNHFNFNHSISSPLKLACSSTHYCVLYPNHFLILDSYFNLLRKIYLPTIARNCLFIDQETLIFACSDVLIYNFRKNEFKTIINEKAVHLAACVFKWKKKTGFYFSTNKNEVYRVSETLEVNKVANMTNRITALHKYKNGLVIGEESGLVTIRVIEKKKNKLEIKNTSENHENIVKSEDPTFLFLEIKLENPIYDIYSHNTQLIITDTSGFAYILKNNQLINKIKIKDGPVFASYLKSNYYFIGSDSVLIKYTNSQFERRNICKTKIISLTRNNGYLAMISEDSVVITVKEDVNKIFVNERLVQYSGNKVAYKAEDVINIYEISQSNQLSEISQSNQLSEINQSNQLSEISQSNQPYETNQPNTLTNTTTQSNTLSNTTSQSNTVSNTTSQSNQLKIPLIYKLDEPSDLIFKTTELCNYNRNISQFKLQLFIRNLKYFSFKENFFVFSDQEMVCLYKIENYKLILIKKFSGSADCILFQNYLLLINEEILFYNLETENSHFLPYNSIIHTQNYLIIGNEVLNSDLIKITALESTPILAYESNSQLYTLHSISFLSYKLIYSSNSLIIKGFLIKDFIIHKNNLLFIDSSNLYLMNLEDKFIRKMEVGFVLDSISYNEDVVISKYDNGYCSRRVRKVDKEQYMKK